MFKKTFWQWLWGENWYGADEGKTSPAFIMLLISLFVVSIITICFIL